MAKVVRTPEAGRDIAEILDGLEERSPKAAHRLAAAINARCEAIGRFPEMGRARDELGPGLRSTNIKEYLLFYRLVGPEVRVLRVIHGRRNLPQVLGTNDDE